MRRSRTDRCITVALIGVAASVAALGTARPLAGQDDRLEAAVEQELRAAADFVAARWSQGSVSAIADRLMQRGVGLHTGVSGRETLDPRMTVAALEDLLSRRRTRACRVERVTLAGAGDRGSAEMAWEAVAPGATEVLRYTVFVAFRRDGGEWRISEIRVLP